MTVTGRSKLLSFAREEFPAPPRYVEMPGVGSGIGLVRADTKVEDGDGVGDAIGVGVALGMGEALGDGVGIGTAIGVRSRLDFFLIQIDLPARLRHSNSLPLFLIVSPTFLQISPFLTAACDGIVEKSEREIDRTRIHGRSGPVPLLRTHALSCVLDMLPSCPTVYP